MAAIDHQAELIRAGANISTNWGSIKFFARRYPMGAAGAVIFAVFVFCAPIFSTVICSRFQPQ